MGLLGCRRLHNIAQRGVIKHKKIPKILSTLSMDVVKEIAYLRFADIIVAKCIHRAKPNSLEQSYGA